MERLIILHGFGGLPSKHWYQWLGSELSDQFEVTIPALPNPREGKMSEWLPTLQDLHPDQGTILVGHSLGGTLILRYLENAPSEIAAFFTVGAPINDLARDDLHATGFFDRDFNWSTIREQSQHRYVLASTDDESVPFWQGEFIAKQTNGKLVTFTDKGHFRLGTFPELADLIRTKVSEHEPES